MTDSSNYFFVIGQLCCWYL